MNKEKIFLFIKKYKIQIIIFLTVIIALIIGLIISFNFKKVKTIMKKDQDITANTNAEVIKEETYEGLVLNNISLITENGYSTFTADVTNTNQTDSNIKDINIVLKDKKGNIVITLRGHIGENLKSNEKRTITAVTKGNLNNVYSKEIKAYENAA